MKKKSLLMALAAGGAMGVAGVASAGPNVVKVDGLRAMQESEAINIVSIRSHRTGKVHYFDRNGHGSGERQDFEPVYDLYTLPGARNDRNYGWTEPGDYPGGGSTGSGTLWVVPAGPDNALPRPAPPHPDTQVPTSINFEEYATDPDWDGEGPVFEMAFGFGVDNAGSPNVAQAEISWLFFDLVEDPTHGTVVEFADGVTVTFDVPADTVSVFSIPPGDPLDLSGIGGLEIPTDGIVLRDYPPDFLFLHNLGVFWPTNAGDVDPNAPHFPHPSELIQVGDNDFETWLWIGADDVNPANDAQPPYNGSPTELSYLDVVLAAIAPADPADPPTINWAYSTPAGEPFPYERISSSFPLMLMAEFEGFAGCGPADINEDGIVNIQDFFLYLDWFDAGDPRADLTGNGLINIQDFFEFLSLYELGCTN